MNFYKSSAIQLPFSLYTLCACVVRVRALRAPGTSRLCPHTDWLTSTTDLCGPKACTMPSSLALHTFIHMKMAAASCTNVALREAPHVSSQFPEPRVALCLNPNARHTRGARHAGCCARHACCGRRSAAAVHARALRHHGKAVDDNAQGLREPLRGQAAGRLTRCRRSPAFPPWSALPLPK